MLEERYTDQNAALRASSNVLKYSFSFLAFVLFGTVIGGTQLPMSLSQLHIECMPGFVDAYFIQRVVPTAFRL